MRIRSLKIRNFRNHKQYKLQVSPDINVILGKNGAGKTSLLEACSLLLLARSFRNGKNWIKEGEKETSLHLEFEKKEGAGEWSLFTEGHKKSHRHLNKKPSRKKEEASCVFFGAEDLFSIRGDASYRRKLVDELILSSKEAAKIYSDFKNVLAQKNKFLKLCKKGHYSTKDQDLHLSNLNNTFIQRSLSLIWQRQVWLEKIKPFWKEEGRKLLKTEDFSCQYIDSKGELIKKGSDLKIWLEEKLQNHLPAEKMQGLSLVGPHRDDLLFSCYKKEARHSLSQGQQRALILSWKLAQWRLKKEQTQESPCLFLDDVFSEIDQHFRKNLIDFLVENEAQVFITTNEKDELYNHPKIRQIHLGEQSERNEFTQTEELQI